MHDHAKKLLQFLAVFLGIFFLAALMLSIIDFIPEAPKAAAHTAAVTATTTDQATATETPVHVRIPAANIDTSVQNPTSTDISVLDDALLKGAAHYPGSALLGENATMYLFGHQSYLPVVHNHAFQAFNGLQKLQPGDDIIVSSATNDYHYRVTSVDLVDAGTAWVDLNAGAKKLILTTCDSFGTKTQRYVVKADFVSESPIASAGATQQFIITS